MEIFIIEISIKWFKKVTFKWSKSMSDHFGLRWFGFFSFWEKSLDVIQILPIRSVNKISGMLESLQKIYIFLWYIYSRCGLHSKMIVDVQVHSRTTIYLLFSVQCLSKLHDNIFHEINPFICIQIACSIIIFYWRILLKV